MHFHGWGLGLKTGMYYLRTKAAVDAIKFTVDVDKARQGATASAAGYAGQQEASDVEKKAIEALKAGTTESACLNCSA